MTVSRVINGSSNVRKETRERVLEAIRELSYYPNAAARALNRNRTNVIEVTMPHRDYFYSSEYFSELIYSVEAVARTEDYNVIFNTYNPAGDVDYGSLYRQRKVDGLLVVARTLTGQDFHSLFDGRIPFVLVNSRRDDLPLSSVDVDNKKGAGLAVDCLASLGHTAIGMITGGTKAINSVHRLQGFRDALSRQGLAVREDWILEGDWSEESGYAGFQRLRKLPDRPSAVFCANDLMAIGAMRSAVDNGLAVPEEVSVIGFDDIRLASFVNPRLTTVRQPISNAGEIAARILLDQLAGRQKSAKKVVLEPELVMRSSCSRRKEIS